MSLPFAEISTLLSRLEDIEHRDPPYLNAAEKSTQTRAVIESWFKSHRNALNEMSIEDGVAFLSTLLPHRRTDRVYGIQAPGLGRILSRSLHLNAARAGDLQVYKQKGRGDLGVCVERTLAAGGPPALPPVTLVEIDDLLLYLAGQCRFSGPNITRQPPRSSDEKVRRIGDIVKRLSPCEAKWLVRLILKDFSPVRINEVLVLKSFHLLLPDLLQFQNDFQAAVRLLSTSLADYPSSCDPRSEKLHRQSAREKLKPVVGIKVGGPQWTKARSIDHCMKMVAGQRWVLERKYDGEYCEIHIDLNRSPKVSECITIFSKSSKDSTLDRIGLHQTIIECLRLRQAGSKIKRQAILLGEMVVYSDTERRVLPFEKIRGHVTRSGSYIGTDCDSQPRPHEHLAIVFFDLLLLDDELVLNKPIDERRMYLREIYRKIGGRAMSAEWKIVDFSNCANERKALVNQFAASIAERCEGLVMKPCGVPYFALECGSNGRQQSFIKLKKDYMAGLGDEADFAIIGASYDAQQALKCGLLDIQWTDFHLGCLTNKLEVKNFDARPCFRVVGTIRQEFCIPKPILKAANTIGKFCARTYAPDSATAVGTFNIDHSGMSTRMDVAFDQPFVFEVLGAGFEKPSNSNFFMLRHPRVKKLHQDRSWMDCVSFEELQKQAEEARAAPVDSESQEVKRWVERLEKKCKRKFERQRASKTPSTVRTAVTVPSLRRSTVKSTTTGSALEGTTLLVTDSTKRKRQVDDAPKTPFPENKRQRRNSPLKSQLPSPTRNGTRASPLSDITNIANNSALSSRPAIVPQQEPPNADIGNKTHATSPRTWKERLFSLFRPSHDLRTSPGSPLRSNYSATPSLSTAGPTPAEDTESPSVEWRPPPEVVEDSQEKAQKG